MAERYIRSIAPARIDAGGPTDVYGILKEGTSTGCVFNASITPGAVVEIRSLPGKKIRIHAHDFRTTESYSNIDDLISNSTPNLLTAAITRINPDDGFDLSVGTGLPPGAGLGTSASIAVATLGGLHAFKDESYVPAPESLAKEAIDLEVEQLKIAGGFQDQYAAAFGGANAFSCDQHGYEHKQLVFSPETSERLLNRLIIVYSGKSRFSGKILDSIIEGHKERSLGILSSLNIIRDLAEEIMQTVLEGNVDKFGKLLLPIWRAQSALHEGISTREIDDILQAALKLGALGGKGLGAGGGGCVLIACPEGKKEFIKKQLRSKYKIVNFKFSPNGIQIEVDGHE
jgi:D-glycero-alpha-D-manno-heptose-7-phosphate kinase